MNTSTLMVGLMSGTSLDGVDAVLIDFENPTPLLACHHYLPYPEALKRAALALHDSHTDELHNMALLSNQLAHLYADAVAGLLEKAAMPRDRIRAVACHGQTIRHRPERGYTLQIGNLALLAELVNIDVVGDFRSRDVAAGGQGAPLVPAFHHALFSQDGTHRTIVNIGGIANITDLPIQGPVRGFDTGPGNLLMDAWIWEQRHQSYDRNGDWAAQGHSNNHLLQHLLTHQFFRQPPPKSTGRDEFNLAWLHQQPGVSKLSAVDVQATLLMLSAQSIADAIKRYCNGTREVYLCGGGARNLQLRNAIQKLLPGMTVADTDVLGVPVDWVEAFAMAWFGWQMLHRQPANLPEVTGARGRRVLGALYPA